MQQKSRNQSNLIEVYGKIVYGLGEFIENNTYEVWDQIFWTLNIYIGKDGPISIEAQAMINYYLQSNPEPTQFSSFINKNKELICKIFDLGTKNGFYLDSSISRGSFIDLIPTAITNGSIDNSSSISCLRLVNLCVVAVAIYFSDFLMQFKQSNGMNRTIKKRLIPKIINKKNFIVYSSISFLNQLIQEPVILLDSFLDNVKPALFNYLNIESLLELTSPHFKNKKGMLTGRLHHENQFIARVINLNSLFDASYTGRRMIQSRLSQIPLTYNQQNLPACWSLLTYVNDLQFQLLVILEKLPLFLRPRSNGDILSYSRNENDCIFKYQLSKQGYIETPLLSEFFQVFLNIGKICFQLICFPYTQDIANSIASVSSFDLTQNLDKLNIKYSKVLVGPNCIGVVPNKNFYIFSTTAFNDEPNSNIQMLFWNVLPKYPKSIANCIQVYEMKKKTGKDCINLPMEQIFLDYLSHEYLKIKDEKKLLADLHAYLKNQINHEQEVMFKFMNNFSQLSIEKECPTPDSRFCVLCRKCFINFFCRTVKKEAVCVSCSNQFQKQKVEAICYSYAPNDIRYPLNLIQIYLEMGKIPNESIVNKYEKNVCSSQFIGSVEAENCKSEVNGEQLNSNINCSAKLKKQEVLFHNRFRELKIVSTQEMIYQLALKEPKNEGEKQKICKRAKQMIQQVQDPISIIRNLSAKIDEKNMTLDFISIFCQLKIKRESNNKLV